MPSITLQNWFKKFIVYFREQSKKLDHFNSNDFNSPCQIDAIWFQDDQKESNLQIFIFTRWDESSDLDFNLMGPEKFSNMVNSLDSFIKNKKWDKQINDEYIIGNTYSEALEEKFVHIFKTFDQTFSLTNSFRNQMHVTEDCFCWVFNGNIQEMDVNELFEMAYEHELLLTDETPQNVTVDNQTINTNLVKGYGTFFYPAIWIGTPPNPSFKERIRGITLQAYIKAIYITKYKERLLIVESDGFIAIAETNKDKALDLLNEIMGTALLLNIQNIKIKDFELINVEINTKTKSIGSFQGPVGLTRTRLLEERMDGDPTWYSGHKSFLKEKNITQIIEKSKELNLDPEYKNFLGFFFEAFTHLYNREYSQSFIMSWTILEKYLYTLWEEMLNNSNNKISEKRMKRLLRWNLHPVLDIINLYGGMDDSYYDLLNELKSKRNKIVHRGETCSKEYAEKCLGVARHVLLNGINPSERSE